MGIDPVGWSFIALTVAGLPWLAAKNARRLAALEAGGPGPALPTGARLMVRVIVLQVVLLAIGLSTAWRNDLDLFPPLRVGVPEALLGVLFLAGGTGTLRWRYDSMSARRRARLALLMPHSGREWVLFAPTAFLAGIGEEICFRGVLVALLQRASGSWWLAAGIAALAFSLAHATQGRRAVGLILVHSALFHAIVRVAGSLYLVMALHTIHDLVAGLVFGRLTRGLRPGGGAPSPALTPPGSPGSAAGSAVPSPSAAPATGPRPGT